MDREDVLTPEPPQTGTLSSLLNLSDAMPKYDTYFTQTVSKLLDTIRSLVADDKQKLQSYATVSGLGTDEMGIGSISFQSELH